MFTSYFVAYTIFAPIVGYLSDSMGSRKVIASFAALLGIGAILMGFSHHPQAIYLFSFLMGAGGSACWTPIVGLLSRWSSPSRRGMAIGIVLVGTGLGFSAMGLILPLFVGLYGWRLSWVFPGLIMVLFAFFDWLLLREAPIEAGGGRHEISSNPDPQKRKPSRVSYRGIFRSLDFWLITVSYFFYSFTLYVAMDYLPTFAIDELGFEKILASTLMTAIGLGTLPGSLLFPTLSDRFGRKAVLIACDLAFALIFLGFASFGGYLPLAVISFLFGMFSWGGVGIYASSAAEYFPPESSGSVMGLWTISYGMGAFISPPIAGFLADVSGSFFFAFILALVTGLISSFLLLPLGRRLPPQEGL